MNIKTRYRKSAARDLGASSVQKTGLNMGEWKTGSIFDPYAIVSEYGKKPRAD
jgi:hypothetical protein